MTTTSANATGAATTGVNATGADATGAATATRHTAFRCAPGDPLFAERYRAIDSRDARFDGQFFTAVSSTGIYCRPSCPARTPKVENVTFYLTSAAAHEAGFRACKRCLPEATPGTPEWDLRRDLAGRAMRLIADGVVDREGVDGLGARLGYTARHVHRLLVSELGASPVALARARRAQSARTLLVDSDLPISQVAFAAGFGSVRQFNETIQEVFAVRPRELRAKSHSRRADGAQQTSSDVPTAFPRDAAGLPGSDASPLVDAPVLLDLDLPVRQPFDALGVFQFLAARAVSGVEVAELPSGAELFSGAELPSGAEHPADAELAPATQTLRYARTLTLPHGAAAVEIVAERTAPSSPWRLRVKLELASLADVAPAVARVRRLLDLDADPVAIDAALSADAALAPLVAATPGIRVPGAVDPHEMVLRALIGQQISVAAARTHLTRLASRVGSPYVSSIPGLTRLFPTPAQVVAAVPYPDEGDPLDPDRPLRLPGQAIRGILAAERALADGDLVVDVGADADTLRSALVARPRIGPWTASYISMRVLGDPDAWLLGDVALIAGAKSVGLLDDSVTKATSHRILAERAGAWAPWRSYAMMHLWQAATAAAAATHVRTARPADGRSASFADTSRTDFL